MSLVGVKCVLGYVGMEDHRKCMVTNPGPPCGIEPTILELMTKPSIEREESEVVFSPSSLSTCHRQTVLQGRHDYYLDVKAGYKRIRGSIVHEGLGHEPPYPGVLGVVRELRMGAPISTKYGEQTFKGKPDLVVLLGVDTNEELELEAVTVGMDGKIESHTPAHLNRHTRLHVKIVDYKSVGEVRHDLVAAERKHVYQVNMYAWLVQRFLPGWLNRWTRGMEMSNQNLRWDEDGDYKEHIFLGEGVVISYIDEVVVDELSIQYLDMNRTRSFTSKGFLYDQGKMLSDKVGGRWVRRKPAQYEELELEPIHQFSQQYIESIIRKGIEDQIEAETVLAAPLEGEDARIMCPNCPVRQVCYDTGRKEGYGMEWQAPYVSTEAGDE